MEDDIQKYIDLYQQQLHLGYIQIAYKTLIQYIGKLKSNFPELYQTGNISMGYLDYTYFPFFNSYLREHKLRFGIVLNHEKMQIELWLMGQNINIQKQYWNLLKDTKWNQKREMPKYSILEIVLEEHIDFSNQEKIISQSLLYAKHIQDYLEENEGEF